MSTRTLTLREVERLTSALYDVRVQVDDLLAWVPLLDRRSLALASAGIGLVCDWCSEVGSFLLDLGGADSRRTAAARSCVYVRDYLSPTFDALDRACAADEPVRAAALRLYGAVVDLNWQLAVPD